MQLLEVKIDASAVFILVNSLISITLVMTKSLLNYAPGN